MRFVIDPHGPELARPSYGCEPSWKGTAVGWIWFLAAVWTVVVIIYVSVSDNNNEPPDIGGPD